MNDQTIFNYDCPTCGASLTLDTNTEQPYGDGSNGEWGWCTYEVYCPKCNSELTLSVSDEHEEYYEDDNGDEKVAVVSPALEIVEVWLDEVEDDEPD